MKIISLTASNVKRLEAVHIEPDPDGHMVVISGQNGAGKSSVLDAIAYALGGKDLICDEPIRRGERKASIVVDLDNGLRVERTFTPGGGRLKVTPKDGAPVSQPQTLLDKLLGRIAFDPLAFSRMRPREQRETLAALVGLDTTDLDTERQGVYEERTGENREMHRLEGVLSEVERDDDAPSELVDVSELVVELRSAEADQAEFQRLEGEAKSLKAQADVNVKHAEDWIEEAKRLNEQIVELKNKAKAATDAAEAASADAGDLLAEAMKLDAILPDRDAIQARIDAAEGINAKVRANQKFTALAAGVSDHKTTVDRLTGKLNDLDAQKLQRIADAKYPIAALALDEECVLYQTLPLAQASQAERLRVSIAIGIAMNPELRVLLIRDGSLLDDSNLALVGEMAEKSDSQVFIERVEEDAATSVVIEAGRVKGAPVEEGDDGKAD